jgi:hypothetical protein
MKCWAHIEGKKDAVETTIREVKMWWTQLQGINEMVRTDTRAAKKG